MLKMSTIPSAIATLSQASLLVEKRCEVSRFKQTALIKDVNLSPDMAYRIAVQMGRIQGKKFEPEGSVGRDKV